MLFCLFSNIHIHFRPITFVRSSSSTNSSRSSSSDSSSSVALVVLFHLLRVMQSCRRQILIHSNPQRFHRSSKICTEWRLVVLLTPLRLSKAHRLNNQTVFLKLDLLQFIKVPRIPIFSAFRATHIKLIDD